MDDEAADEPLDSLLAAVARIPAKRLERTRAWTPPEELDEYRLLQPIGRGGMGSVWLAEDRLLDRLVAVKFIAHAELDAHARERFAIEARAAARLQHGNVVTVHRYGEIAGRPYLVSEYIRGESLDKLARPVPWQRALELGIALARGLAATHRHGIVHRDIKPANAILSADGEVKLVDFGLAKLAGTDAPAAAARASTDPTLTEPGAIAGTPLYLAPEVRAGEPATRRSDIYQLGCILFELVAGKPAALVDAPTLAPLAGGDGVAFAAVVDRCLRADPAERFASGDELREALERIAAPVAGGELPEGNPYRGLVAFEAEHRALFFGRGSEIRAVIERLRSDPCVLVTGDSGVGKSSLCRAGVLPHVVDGALGDGRTWRSVALVPGQRPLATLAAALELDEDVLTERPADVVRELRRALGRAGGLALFIDQLEELVTISDHDEAAAFGRVLAQLAAGAPGVRVLATVRGDFVTRVAALPALEDELARALYVLRPLSREAARDAVVGPARAKGGRFESEQLVDALVAEHDELPLLAFTLAQLWDARDPATQTISERSLAAIGGVRGALARHADGVFEALLPAQRAVARRVLLRLVTPEHTRARRSAAELGSDAASALDALVRGRLVVARGADPPLFELAHERLIDGWPALAGWLSETADAIAVHHRLATAVASWEQLDRAKEALWRDRQLVDLARLSGTELTPSEAAFAAASRRAARRRRAARITAAIALPAAAISIYVGARVIAQRDVARRVADNVAIGERELAQARTAAAETARLSRDAFARFDAGDTARGEELWASARARAGDASVGYAQASRALEAALLADSARGDVRSALAEVTFERIAIAEHEYRRDERAELATRLALYDDGTFAQRLTAPGRVVAAVTPVGARIVLADGRQLAGGTSELAPGSYVATASAPGRATVRVPFTLHAGAEQRLAFELPAAAAVPAGFVYIPAGTFLYGSRDDEALRLFYGAPPMHERATGAYLIGTTEVTYAQWIAFLDALPPAERDRRVPRVGIGSTVQEGDSLELRDVAGRWELHIAPSSVAYTARAGEPLEYRDRDRRKRQDWSRLPVSAISPEDAEAYASWLDRTHRVPHARLCTETEWERAVRGVDGRAYPSGDQLGPDDADIDVTYGRREGGYGPDEVGSHPASTSPFGLADGAGNVLEIVRAAGGFVLCGGSFYTGANVAPIANRQVMPPTLRHLQVGLRICADP